MAERTKEMILSDLQAGKINMHECVAQLNAYEKAHPTPKPRKVRALSIKIGNKKNVVVSGLQQYPTTHYARNWHRLLEYGPNILKFIEDNKDKLDMGDGQDDEPAEKQTVESGDVGSVEGVLGEKEVIPTEELETLGA